MENWLSNFKFTPDGTATLEEALCAFIKQEISFGRIKGGDKFPTISEIGKVTGLSFGKARVIVNKLAREGYVRSRPHIGTVVISRGKRALRGRVLFILPGDDICRYHPAQAINVLSRRMTAAGYAFSVATFDAGEDLAFLKSDIVRETDLVIAARATPKVQKCLAEAGVNHIFAYGDKPKDNARPWVRFSPETAISQFADHCARAGVKRVMQVRFEGNETLDAQPALAKRGIDSFWMTISRGGKGRGRFDGVVFSSYEAFEAMPRIRIPDLVLFWNSFVTQGAVTAFLDRGIRLPEDVKVVTLSNTGVGPVYTKPFTRFEVDPIEAWEKVADFALAVLAKGRIPSPPQISPHYIYGATFPF